MRADGDAGRGHPARAPVPAGIVAILNLALPGLGHFFLGMWSRGATWFAGWLAIGAISDGHSLATVLLMLIAAFDALYWGLDHERRYKAARRDTDPV